MESSAFLTLVAKAKKSSAISNGGVLLFAQVIAQGSAFIVGIWTAKVLTQEEYGAYRLLLTVVSYLSFTNLGISQYVLFKLPIAIGRKDREESVIIPSVFHSFLFVNRGILLIFATSLALYGLPLNGIQFHLEWFLTGLILMLTGWNSLFEIIFRSSQAFKLLGSCRIFYSLAYLIGIAALMPVFKINGILLATILGALIYCFIGLSRKELPLIWTFERKRLLDSIKFGFPVVLSSFAWMMLTSCTIWIVTAYYTPAQTGIFGFAMVIATAYKVLPSILGEMTSPRFLACLGKIDNDEEQMRQIMTSGSIAWAGINVIFAIFTLMVFYLLIQLLLPQYKSSWPLMLFIVLGYYCYNICATAGNTVIHHGQAPVLLLVNSIIVVFQIGFGILIAKYTASFSLIGLVPMSGLLVSSLVVLYLAYYDNSKAFKVSEHFWKILLRMMLGVTSITISWGLISLYTGWIWFASIVSVSIVICLPQTVYGLKQLKIFWKITK